MQACGNGQTSSNQTRGQDGKAREREFEAEGTAGKGGLAVEYGAWTYEALFCLPARLLYAQEMLEYVLSNEKMINDTVDMHGIKMDRRNGNTQTRVIIIDKHKIPHYDKNSDMTHLVYSKHDAGTYVFESHMTAKMVSGAKESHLAMVPVTRDKFNPEFVRKTIQKCDKLNADASICLLDREFYASDVMCTIRDLKKQAVSHRDILHFPSQ